MKQEVNIVWFKRDLRLLDHEPLMRALSSNVPALLLYIFEPILLNDAHYSKRHFDFIKQSLVNMNEKLAAVGSQLLVIEGDAMQVFETLQNTFDIRNVFSHQETGLLITYKRDATLKEYFKSHKINWSESIANGVVRGLKNRTNWKEHWIAFINKDFDHPNFDNSTLFGIPRIAQLEACFKSVDLNTGKNTPFQKGGTTTALKYFEGFLEERINGYNTHYSKPLTSRNHSSRLSPYLAWGNMSIRMVAQKAASFKSHVKNKRNLNSFLSRLRWQAHFIEKFEMEYQMEYRNVHAAFRALEKPSNLIIQQAWKEGNTGYPMVDAGMRCLVATGFVNFRIRAMLVSFFTHHLWQPWQDASVHMAQQFLDFEPGIHYPQLQMQAGVTGINTVRIYSPVRNSLDHDPEAVFLKKWLPELAHLPISYIHEPWKMPAMEAMFHNFELGRDYPLPIVEAKLARKHAQDVLYGIKKDAKSKQESRRIVNKHTNPGREIWPGGDKLRTS
jgi:deoxyribodipyrimidine photo-lyase